MARSRYSNNSVVDGYYFGTWRNPVAEDYLRQDMLKGVQTVEHVFSAGDRLDILANKYFGDDQYYWVIALVNDIVDPFSLTPGITLRIPTDIKKILSKLQR